MEWIDRARTEVFALALGAALAAPLGCGGGRDEAALPDVAARAPASAEAQAPKGSQTADATRAAVVSQARQRLDAIERQIDSLRDTARGEGGDALARTADELESERQQATAQLDTLRNASADEWKSLRDGLEKRIDDLEQRSDAAAART
jgi:hypothetical protein